MQTGRSNNNGTASFPHVWASSHSLWLHKKGLVKSLALKANKSLFKNTLTHLLHVITQHNQHTPKSMRHLPDVPVMELEATKSNNVFAAIFKLWLIHTIDQKPAHAHTVTHKNKNTDTHWYASNLTDHEIMRELKHMHTKTIETRPWLSSHIQAKIFRGQSAPQRGVYWQRAESKVPAIDHIQKGLAGEYSGCVDSIYNKLNVTLTKSLL